MLNELLVIALPIGNAGDLTERAKSALFKVDGVLAEDTRKFKEFCKWASLDITAEVQSFHASTEREVDFQKLFSKLKGTWALVSDAGAPAVNDPGSLLIKTARQQGIKITALPGASALTMAIQLTGGFGNPVSFLGFPPKKVKKEFFENFNNSKTIVFFESKHNVLSTLETLDDSLFQKSNLVCLREMTKDHEEYFEGIPKEHIAFFKKKLEKDQVGELTFVLEAMGEQKQNTILEAKDLVEFRSAAPSQAAKILSKISGISRTEAYDLLKNNE